MRVDGQILAQYTQHALDVLAIRGIVHADTNNSPFFWADVFGVAAAVVCASTVSGSGSFLLLQQQVPGRGNLAGGAQRSVRRGKRDGSPHIIRGFDGTLHEPVPGHDAPTGLGSKFRNMDLEALPVRAFVVGWSRRRERLGFQTVVSMRRCGGELHRLSISHLRWHEWVVDPNPGTRFGGVGGDPAPAGRFRDSEPFGEQDVIGAVPMNQLRAQSRSQRRCVPVVDGLFGGV